jgi:dextranase
MRLKLAIILFALALASCEKKNNSSDSTPEAPSNSATPAYQNVTITTDKAAYNPGDEVVFTMDNSNLPATAKVRYKYLNTVLEEAAVTSSSWIWKTPATDFRGYIAEVYSTDNGVETIYAVIGIDVSSEWTKFPRYGFLSKFPVLTDNDINATISSLNRYHINGVQFYDWQNKHHMPLAVVNALPASSWQDIIGRYNYLSTIQKYIEGAHNRNMKAMFYNLVYGAWNNAENDGVQKEWYVYTDNTHVNRDFHPLSSPFLSNIYLLDPSNTSWQKYIEAQNRIVYQYLNFDGYHMDQLGDRGTRYKYDGTNLVLSQTYKPFIESVKADEPQKYIVMNAVNQYGQQGIASASSDFLYTEVWSPFDAYSDLANLIKQNNTLSNNTKNTILAAYMNYDLANNIGYFNTPSVLMTDAIIFAFGGAHLELGEHMLGKEYFPNDNLKMKDDLKSALVNYYDFLVGYQNLLRDGGNFNTVTISSSDNKIGLSIWPEYQGKVTVIGKKVDNKQVIHLINFTNSTTQNWRDNNGIQVIPGLIQNAAMVLTSDIAIKRMWIASPDFIGGASRSINFSQSGNCVSFILPELKYWDMLVIEYN